MKPLSVGNIVNAGLRIYRDNFKKYYRLAFIAALWSFIPVYGWAKFYAAHGLISRLAFGEIAEKPESIRDAERHVQGKFWSFLVAALFVGLKLLIAYVLGTLVFGFIIAAIIVLLSSISGNSANTIFNSILSIMIIVVAITGFILFCGYLVKVLASLFVSELALAVENTHNASQSLRRSKELTQGFVRNVVIVLIISAAVSFPLWSLILTLQIVPSLIPADKLPIPSWIFLIIQLVFNAVTTALLIPLWQSIKAVVYYDLRVRREGMGINLRK